MNVVSRSMIPHAERRRAADDLVRFRAVAEASHEAVAILSADGRVLYANPAFGRLFALDVREVEGLHYRTFFPPQSQAVLDAELAPALRRGESWEGVMDAWNGRGGAAFPLWQRAGVVRDRTGGVEFFFAFMHDHTDQQVFEDELIAAKEAAEEANLAKTRFLAAASHDLRQPMQALGMFVAVLAGRNRDSGQATLVSRIQDSVTALEGLLNSLLDISKLEAGLVVARASGFAVAPLMARLAEEFAPLCEAEGVGLRVVPSTAVAVSDPALLERILRNLLNNAVRYTPSGRILFGCRRVGPRLRFEVWDTGIGIPTGELRDIFREFHQVGNSARDRRQGLGLGLAIVDRLARLLGHRVGVRSQEGRGSVFSVEVPCALNTVLPAPRQLPLGLTRKGAAVVVVDDEPDVLDSLRLLLESWGHVVLPAASTDEAVRRLPDLGRPPDLVVADYRLQNGDTGGQAIARLELHLGGRKVPAIILTGDTAPERLRQAQALGHGLLHKPVQAESLRQAIEAALDGATAPQRGSARRRKKA